MLSKDPRQRIARTALAKSNTVSINIEGVYETDRQKFQAMAQDLGITFDGNNNVLDNDIKDDVSTNTSNISSIDSKFSSGYSGTVTVITGVDFTAETTTTKTLTIEDGLITGVA
jgi:hypothetical protein